MSCGSLDLNIEERRVCIWPSCCGSQGSLVGLQGGGAGLPATCCVPILSPPFLPSSAPLLLSALYIRLKSSDALVTAGCKAGTPVGWGGDEFVNYRSHRSLLPLNSQIESIFFFSFSVWNFF